jgi:conjugal transfer mating pair stabilization protein TraN
MKQWVFALLLLLAVTCNAQVGSCVKTGTTCTQGPETRSINGFAVYKACWQTTDTYSCYESNVVDTCAPLRPVAGCFELSSACAETNFQGACVRFSAVMRCDHLEPTPVGATARTPVFTVTSDQLIESAQCATLRADANCLKTARTCTTGPATRNINGLDVYKECWEYTDTYACVGTVGAIDFCKPLKATPICTEITTGGYPRCAVTAANGTCIEFDRQYTCNAVPVTPLPSNVTIINQVVNVVADALVQSAICQAKIADGTCRKTGSICIDGPSTKTINGVPTTKDCWQFQDTYTCDVVGGTGATNYCAPLEAK